MQGQIKKSSLSNIYAYGNVISKSVLPSQNGFFYSYNFTIRNNYYI